MPQNDSNSSSASGITIGNLGDLLAADYAADLGRARKMADFHGERLAHGNDMQSRAVDAYIITQMFESDEPDRIALLNGAEVAPTTIPNAVKTS